jgi:hypothetical protein
MLAFVDRWLQETDSTTTRSRILVFAGFRFPPEVISLAVVLSPASVPRQQMPRCLTAPLSRLPSVWGLPFLARCGTGTDGFRDRVIGHRYQHKLPGT